MKLFFIINRDLSDQSGPSRTVDLDYGEPAFVVRAENAADALRLALQNVKRSYLHPGYRTIEITSDGAPVILFDIGTIS